MRRAPWERTSASSRSCRSQALAADLGEARRDDDERPHAVAQRILGRRVDVLAPGRR